MTETTVVEQHFDDFDQFVESIRGWDWDPVQIGPGPLALTQRTVHRIGFVASRMSFGPKIADRSGYFEGLVGFSLALGHALYCGRPVGPGTLAVMVGGREARSVFEPGFACLELSVAESLVTELEWGRRLLDSSRSADELVFDLGAAGARALGTALRSAVCQSGLGDAPVASSVTLERLLDLVGTNVAAQLDSTGAGSVQPTKARYSLAREALRVIERTQDSSAALSVDALATELGVTSRALQLAFRSVLGVTPLQFLHARRLTRARAALLSSSRTVLEAAQEQHFDHPSRFARRYARLFGELPSHTLERAKLRAS